MRRCTLFAGAAAIVAAPAFAHDGSRIWLDQIGGSIITLTSDNDISPTVYTPARVFDTELLNFFGVQTTEFPGYEVRRTGAHVTSGTTFGFNLNGPLLFYDSTVDRYIPTHIKFAQPSPGGIPEMAVSIDETIRFSTDQPVAGFNFLTYFSGGEHGHLSYTMVSGGTPYDGPTGVYALPMQLTGTGLSASATCLLLLGKGVTQGSAAFIEAHSIAQQMINSPGDANLDGIVDAKDLGRMAIKWQAQGGWFDGDFNLDGRVNVLDLVILSNHWYAGTAQASVAASDLGLGPTAVPEPAMVGLLGGLALLLPRCRRAGVGW